MVKLVLNLTKFSVLAGTSPKPLTRAEHERRVSARLPRGVAPDGDMPKRLGASASGTTANRYRDPTAVGPGAAGYSGIPRGGASKDLDGGVVPVQRTTKQSKK